MKSLLLILCCCALLWAPGCAPAAPPPAPMPLPTWTNTIGMKFVKIPKGTFRMGWKEDIYGGDTIHQVTLSSFWIGEFEVTNAQFKLFKTKKILPKFAGNTQPAISVTWYEAKQFCQWLSKREGLDYRLPTEAEWEYAARGGLDQKLYPWGNEDGLGRANAWNQATMPVGSFPPNGYNLYDTAGNAAEWVNDYFGENYYKVSPQVNPPGPAKTDADWIRNTGTDWRVARGGYWGVIGLEVGQRWPLPLDEKNPMGSGFRVVLSALPSDNVAEK